MTTATRTAQNDAEVAEHRQLLRLATAGSVDDGKSTLIGRILLDTDSIPDDQLASVRDAHGEVDLASLSDGLRAEREQGITIDVAYRFFDTPSRSYILADTPGHESYTRNMFTGASNAHVVILLIDAREGVVRQTRRHARIASLLGARHIVAAVNKVDLVGFDEDRFREVEAQVHTLSDRVGGPKPVVIPLAALTGDNVVKRSENVPWYQGPTLLEYLESVDLSAPAPQPEDLRLPIQWVGRPTDSSRRRYAGRLSAGTLTVGDEVTALPSGSRSRVSAVDVLDDERAIAVAPLSVSVELADDIDVGRGDVLVSTGDAIHHPVAAREIDATVCWFSPTPLRAGDRLLVKHGTRTVHATVQEISGRLNPDTLEIVERPTALELNDLGTVTLRTSTVILADPYTKSRDGGSFIFIDEAGNDTVGAGTIDEARQVLPGQRARTDIRWHPSSLRRQHRWESTGQTGVTVWFTGRPASGKSTVAVELERTLVEQGRVAYLLDGDNIRHGISDDLGFSAGDRAENIRRVGHLSRLFADSGATAIAALVSPLESDREGARRLHKAAGLPFIEVYVSTSTEVCAERDPKGLYAKAKAGQISGLSGWDAPYEEPDHPDLVIDTSKVDADEAVRQIIQVIDDYRSQWVI